MIDKVWYTSPERSLMFNWMVMKLWLNIISLKKLNVHEQIVHSKVNYMNLESRVKFIASLINFTN